MAQVMVDAGQLARRITVVVEVRGLCRFKVRAAVGLALVRLGVWLMGFGLDVRAADSSPERPAPGGVGTGSGAGGSARPGRGGHAPAYPPAAAAARAGGGAGVQEADDGE